MPELIVGINTAVTLAEADAYLDGSARAGARWPTFTPDQKKRALISSFRVLDRQAWNGTKVPGLLVVESFTVNAPGSGWAANDVATIDGTGHRLGRLSILTETAGAIATAQLTDAGLYTAAPAGLITAVPPSGGTGTTLTLSVIDNPASFPRSDLEDCEGNALTATDFPEQFKLAQMEYAFDIAVNTAAETSGGVGSNLKRAKADTVEVEFFRPTGGANGDGSARFPVYIMELIGCLLAGGGALDPSFYGAVAGMGATSTVADPHEFGLTIP